MGKMLWELLKEHERPPFPLQEPLPDWIIEWMRDKKVWVRNLEALEEMLRDPSRVMDGEPFTM
jgi:hypothetical protein